MHERLMVVFLKVTVPVNVLLKLLLFFSKLCGHGQLTTTTSNNLSVFAAGFRGRLSSIRGCLLGLSLGSTAFHDLDRRASHAHTCLSTCRVTRKFPTMLTTGSILVNIILHDNSNGLCIKHCNTATRRLGRGLGLRTCLNRPNRAGGVVAGK